MPQPKTELTRSEKLAGRVFVAERQQALSESFETDPPAFKVLPWHRIFRHECTARNDVSTALELHEVYEFSPEYVVFSDDHVEIATDDHNGDEYAGRIVTDIPAGRFGFIHKEGQCRGCKKTARSKTGRLVDAHQRPPLEGRIAR